jgi:hypothetical protein
MIDLQKRPSLVTSAADAQEPAPQAARPSAAPSRAQTAGADVERGLVVAGNVFRTLQEEAQDPERQPDARATAHALRALLKEIEDALPMVDEQQAGPLRGSLEALRDQAAPRIESLIDAPVGAVSAETPDDDDSADDEVSRTPAASLVASTEAKSEPSGSTPAPTARITFDPRRVKLEAPVGERSPGRTFFLKNETGEPIPIQRVERKLGKRTEPEELDVSVPPGGTLEPGAIVAGAASFVPKRVQTKEWRRQSMTLRFLDAQGRARGKLKIEGKALPPEQATPEEIEADRRDELRDSARRGDVAIPASFDAMTRTLDVACGLVEKEQYDEALPLAEALYDGVRKVAKYERLEALLKERGHGGLSLQAGLSQMGGAEQASHDLFFKVRKGSTIKTDLLRTQLAYSEETMRLLLGETDDAPNLRAYGAVPGEIAEKVGDVVIAGVAEATQMVRDGKFAAGYVIGLPQGLWSASVDVVEGAVDTASWIADLIGAIFTGDFVGFCLGELDKVADFLGDLDATTEKAGAWFASRWFAEDSFDRGEFRGKVLGYVAFHVVMAVATGGAGASIQARGVFKTIIKLLEAADKLGDAWDWARGAKKSLKGKVPDEVVEKRKKAEEAEEAAEAAAKAAKREERLKELAKDPDKGGQVTDSSKREAEVALALEDAGRLPPPVRRPARGDGHSGDFVDGTGQDWDMKAPMSRSKLIEKKEADAARAGRPVKIDPAVAQRGEFEASRVLNAIRREVGANEKVVIDAAGLTPEDLATLKAEVTAAGFDADVIYYE